MASAGEVTVRPLTEADLPDADRICQLAFGTYVGAAEPETFFGDAAMVATRWRAGSSPGRRRPQSGCSATGRGWSARRRTRRLRRWLPRHPMCNF